jgi:hypothetical protein
MPLEVYGICQSQYVCPIVHKAEKARLLMLSDSWNTQMPFSLLPGGLTTSSVGTRQPFKLGNNMSSAYLELV